MTNDTVVQLVQSGSFSEPVTEVLRNGARAFLGQAVEAEVAEFLGKHAPTSRPGTGVSVS